MGNGANTIERRGISDQTPAANAPIGGFETRNATECGWLTDGTARVGADTGQTQPGLHRHRRAATTTPWHPAWVGGIAHGSKRRILIGGPHRKLVAILSTNHNHVFVQ